MDTNMINRAYSATGFSGLVPSLQVMGNINRGGSNKIDKPFGKQMGHAAHIFLSGVLGANSPEFLGRAYPFTDLCD